jgi:hypothetical protein
MSQGCLYGIKFMRIQEIEILPLGHLEDHPFSEFFKLKGLAVIQGKVWRILGVFPPESL